MNINPFVANKIVIYVEELIVSEQLPSSNDTCINIQSKKKYHWIKNPKTKHIYLNNLRYGISLLNKYLACHEGKRYFSQIIIYLGPGITWVNPNNQRYLTNSGSILGEPYPRADNEPGVKSASFTIGNENCQISQFKILGQGQGTSTIRGTIRLEIINLMYPLYYKYLNTPTNLLIGCNQNFKQIKGTFNYNTSCNNNSTIDIPYNYCTNLFDPLLEDGKSTGKQPSQGSDQLESLLLLQNFFWVGILRVFVIYKNIPYYDKLLKEWKILDKYLSTYSAPRLINNDLKNCCTDILYQHLSVEALCINTWFETKLSPAAPNISSNEPPFQTNARCDPRKPGKTQLVNRKGLPNITPTCLLRIDLPCIKRIFISQSNFITYEPLNDPNQSSQLNHPIKKPYNPNISNLPYMQAIAILKGYFQNPNGPTDTFIQNCSFSGRSTLNESISNAIILVGQGKVSIIDCQFTGRILSESNKLSILNSYILAINGPPPKSYFLPTNIPNENTPVTYGVFFYKYTPSYNSFSFKSEPRCIINNTVFVCFTKKLYSENDLIVASKLPFKIKHVDIKPFYGGIYYYQVYKNEGKWDFDCISLSNIKEVNLSAKKIPELFSNTIFS